MNEIEKLRFRMKNVQKNVTEYRMTVTEARRLLTEIDQLQKVNIIEIPAVVEKTQQIRIMDGGSF
jgi:hypothetical protein